MEGWRAYAACLVITLVILEHGSCFLYKKSSADLDANRNEVSHLKRRYWNDDIQPCIEKFCMRYLGKKVYINCLQHYCPGSLLAVPRDVDDTSLYPISLLLGDTEMCAEGGTGGESAGCVGKGCDLSAGGLTSEMYSTYVTDPVLSFKVKIFKLCQETFCSGEGATDTSLAQCTSERCCEGGAASVAGQGTRDLDSTLRQGKGPVELLPLARKRRIIDEVSQCIQSYCSGKKASKDRIMCIIENCNRMK